MSKNIIMCGRTRFINLNRVDAIQFSEEPVNGFYSVYVDYSNGTSGTYVLDAEEYEVVCRSIYNVVVGGNGK